MNNKNIFWHPHQKLWNGNLIRFLNKITNNQKSKKRIISIIILFDTYIWLVRTRIKYFSLIKPIKSRDFNLNYFDIGTHKNARELMFFVETVLPYFKCNCNIYAFEAYSLFFEEAKEKLKHLKNIKFYNLALFNKIPESGKIRLYYYGIDGLGNSIYRNTGELFEEVTARRLSDVIKEKNIPLKKSVNILRMNIEGAEFDVISDLIDSGLLENFDGFYGMWDDVWKIDPKKDIEFRKLLKKYNIKTFPFNGRDMDLQFRKKIIKENIIKTIFRAALKKTT